MVTNNSSDYSPTQYNVQTGGASGTLNNVVPSATSGVPVISQGSSSQPVFGTAVVAGGGTGATTLTGVVVGSGTSALTATAITQYNVITGGASNAPNSVAPSATSGVPVISQGSSSQPVFGTAVVAGGGTGITSATAYAPICAGTTTTGAFQVASTGLSTSGYVLTSNGSSSLPSFQAAASGGALVKISTQTASSSASLTFTTGFTYTNYLVIHESIVAGTASAALTMKESTNGGSTYLATGYGSSLAYANNAGSGWGGATATTFVYMNLGTGTGVAAGSMWISLPSGGTSQGDGTGFIVTPYLSIVAYSGNTTVNALSFQMTSGNIASGSITLYGVTS